MRPLEARRDTGTRVPAGVHDVLARVMLRIVQQRLDTRLHETPGARVERLLLRPHHGLGVGVHVEVLLELGPGERVELLDARQRDVVELLGGAVLVQRRVDLAGAEDHAVDFLGRRDRGPVLRVRDDPAEVRVFGEVFNVGACERVAEEGFGEEED